jgi:hypothetical protein
MRCVVGIGGVGELIFTDCVHGLDKYVIMFTGRRALMCVEHVHGGGSLSP